VIAAGSNHRTARLIAVVAGLVGLFLALAATRPDAYHVERALEIAAPTDRVYRVLGDVEQLADIFMLFGQPVARLVKAGKAKITIDERVLNQKLGTKLEIESPMKSTSTCAITLVRTSTGSTVTWAMDGSHNFAGRVIGMLVNMDKMLGADLDKGLAQLKFVAEAAPRC